VNEPLRDTDSETEQPRNLATFKAEAWPLLPSLLRVALVLTRDRDRAEDLVQETMMRAYRHIASYRPGTNMKAWLMTILRRTHIDLHRRDARRVSTVAFDPSDLEAIAPAPEPAETDTAWSDPDELLARFDDESIEDALRELPDAMRWVLLLVDVEQMSIAEAAAALDVPEGTVKSRASRARTRLRELLHPVAQQRGWLTEPQGG
jgi:RNA polymerase sigma-70 factor (ECF subfamily)